MLLGVIKEASLSTNGWYIFNCPVCDMGRNKRKCAVHYGYNYVKCWECGLRCFLDKYLRDFEGLSWKDSVAYRSKAIPYRTFNKSGVEMPKGFKLIYEDSTIRDRVIRYITRRGFKEDFLEDKGVGYCYSGDMVGYLVIPFIYKGSLEYWIARDALDRSVLKYINPKEVSKNILYNQSALGIFEEIHITEGVFDAWTIGDNAVATLGWQVNNYQLHKINNSIAKVVNIAADPGYLDKAFKLASQIHGKEVYIRMSEDGDVNSIGVDEYFKLDRIKFSYKNWVNYT